uniref:Integrase catalytic domain-containing protein n=1 Tax=Strongyloides venezuelensis TaxID=75913 RepID=A0A0K0FER7_STRVS
MKSRENIVEKLYMIKEKDESLFNLFLQHEKVYNEQILSPIIEIDIPIVEPFPKRVQAAYPLNYEQKLVLGKKLNNEILDGYMTSILYPSHAVPVTVVHGTNGYRVCNDARLQNHNIIPMDIQLDNIISTILRLTDTGNDNDEERFYSVFDLKSAFKNFSIVPERRFLSNIITPLGIFTSDRLIFGLKSASALFHSTFLNLLEQEGCYNFALYVDDLIVYGSMTEQIQNISKILLLCSRNHIKLNIAKTGLFLKETVYLGQSLTLTTISVTKKRIDELLSLPTPISKSQMYRYLGKLQFVSKFIKDYSTLTKDLHPSKNNCDTNGKFIWNSTRITAFDKIRDNIQNHYIFSIPKNSDQLFCQVFITDVSFTVETYFYPDNTKGYRNILDIFSRIFQKSELNYNYIEKQLLALQEYFSRWSDDNRLPIIETCKLIESILKHDNCSAFSTRIQKLASIMIVKDVQVKVIKQVRTKMLKAITFPEAPLKFDFNVDEVIKFQSTDNNCKTLRTFMDNGNEDCLKKLPVAFSEKAELLEEIQGALAIDKRIIVSTGIAKKLIKKHHLLYHLGETKTYEYFKKIIFCIGLVSFCAQERKNCSVCMEYLNLPVAQVSQWITPIHPRSRGSIDYMFFEGTPIFVLCDNATQYLFAWITPNKSTATIIQCLIPIFSQCPFSFLIMDNAKEFCSNEMLLFLSDFNCQPILVPSYHSKSNGCIERHNQIIRRGLQKNVELGKSLDESLRITLESHNLDKTRKFYCNDIHTEEFMHNRYHNSYSRWTWISYFTVARDYVHMSVPQHLIDADISLHDTIITDQNWETDNDDNSIISIANCDTTEEVSNDKNILHKHDIFDSKTDLKNEPVNVYIFNNVNNELLSLPRFLNPPSASTSPISDLSKSFDLTTGTTLYSDIDIKEFIEVSSSDIFIFFDGSCPNSKASSSNIIKGVGIINLILKEKIMEYYKAQNFFSGRPTSARYEVAAVMLSIILCQNETKKASTLLSDNTYSLEPIDRPEILSKYSSDTSQAQNKL